MEDLLELVKTQPNNINAKMQLARQYINNNDVQSALTLLESVTELEPNNLDANYVLAQIYEFNENYQKAIDCLESVYKLQPSMNFKYKIAQLYESNENYEQAFKLFNECYQSTPDDNDLLEKLAHINRILGNNDEAINFYNLILKNNANDMVALTQLMELYENSNKFLYYSLRAKINLQEGALTYAITSFKKAIPEADNDEDVIKTRLELANIYVQKENYEQAIDEYLHINSIDSKNLEVNTKLAEAYYKLENYESASDAYLLVLEQTPNDIAILKSLSEIYIELDKNAEALALLEKIIKIEPDNYSARVDFARVNIALNNDNQALESLDYVLQKDSKNIETRGVLVDFYILKEDFNKALNFTEEIKKLIPKSPFGYRKSGEIYESLKKAFDSHYNYGIYHDLKGEKQLAIDELTCALEYEPDNVEICTKIGDLYVDINEDYIALEYYHKAYKLEKGNLNILNKMGEIYLRTKEYEHALEVFNKILSLNDRNKEIYFVIAELNEKLKNYNEAIENYQKFVKLAPLSVKTEEANKKITKFSNKLNGNSEEEGLFDKLFKFLSKNK